MSINDRPCFLGKFDLHSAVTWHAPSKGQASGLNGKEMAEIKKRDPKLYEEFNKIAQSKTNQENLQKTREENAKRVEEAQAEYDKAKGNWFTNLFRSEQDVKNEKKAFSKLESAQREQALYNENVVDYRTILMMNGGKEIK